MLIVIDQTTTYLNLWILWNFGEAQGFSGISTNYFMQVIKRITCGCEMLTGDMMA